jgi:hypothetical protein
MRSIRNVAGALGGLGVVALGLVGMVGCSAGMGDVGTTGGGAPPSTTSGQGGAGGATTQSSGTGAEGGGGSSGFAVSNGSGMGCNPQTVTLKQAPPPEVYLVVDRSGSMNLPGAAPMLSRWDELLAAVDSALTAFEAQIHFGLLMYPTGSECGTSGPQVLFADMNRAAINAQLSATTPAGGTPTAAALNNAAASIASFGSPDTTKFLVLATDGGPNCNFFLDNANGCMCQYASTPELCCTAYPGDCVFGNTCLDDQGTIDAVAEIRAQQGIDTFVIGLAGTEAYVSLLDQLADAGGRPQANAPTKFYSAADQMALSNALNTIAASVLSCVIELPEAPEKPEGVTVFVDGVEVPRDMTKMNGWEYTDDTNTKIELYGPQCDAIQDGDEHAVTATFACDVQ